VTAVITRAGVAQAERIARLHAACFTDGWDAPSIARLLSGPGGFALIAAGAEGDVGFALLQCVVPEAELLSIGTVPAARRSGLGRALLQRAAGELAATGADTMFLDVAADNAPALGLYRALGFGDMSSRKRYYPGAIDAIVMRAGLAAIAGA
jgi:ribosomal-protein-alanine N-acetyltransferase